MIRAHLPSINGQWTLIDDLDLKGDERILDIGCGNGKVTAHLASLVPDGSVMGIDLSREMISFAANKYIPEEHPNLSFQIGDASYLGFQEEFDHSRLICLSCTGLRIIFLSWKEYGAALSQAAEYYFSLVEGETLPGFWILPTILLEAQGG